MALALSPRSRNLARRERDLRARERDFARISKPVVFSGDAHVGFGDSTNGRNIIQVGIKGSTAGAIAVIRDRIRPLPMGVFARRFVNGDFEDKPAFNHPLQRVLSNPTFDLAMQSITHSAMQVWGIVVSHLLSVGESYLLILTNGLGLPVGLQIARPGAIEPLVQGGRIVGYRVIGAEQGSRALRPMDVIRIWEPETYDLFTARGVMIQQQSEINMDAHVTATWEQFFKNNATPPILFETDDADQDQPTPEQEEAIGSSMVRRFNRRLGSALGFVFHVKPRWKAKVLDSTLESASGVEMMKWSSQQVMEGLRVSPSLVGRNVDVNRAAAETARFTFDQNTVEPLTELIAEALTLQLANHYPQPSGDVTLVVKYRPFIARDKDFELRKDQADAAAWIRSVNEIRAAREPELPTSSWGNLPLGSPLIGPITGEVADPIDLSSFGLDEPESEVELTPESAEGTEEEETPPEERSLGVRSLQSILRRMRAHFAPEQEWQRVLQRDIRFTPQFEANQNAVLKRQTEITIERYLDSQRARGTRQDDAEDLAKVIFPIDGWQEMFGEALTPIRTAAFVASATEATEAITGLAFNMTQTAREILAVQNLAHYTFVNRSTQDALTGVLRQALEDGIGIDETARRIAGKLGGDSLMRAKRIARTEIAAATQSAQIEGYKQSGVAERKQWNTSLDDLVRDSHTIEGQVQENDDPFIFTNGSQAHMPSDESLPAADRINCRCFVTPVFIDEDALNIGVRPEANEG